MPNPLEKAVKLAERANDDLARITARLGTKAHPRGRVLVAYRVALRALRSALREQTERGTVDRVAIQDTLLTLQVAVEAEARRALQAGADLGADLAARQLDAYGESVPPTAWDATTQQAIQESLAPVLAEIDRQRGTFLALLASGAGVAQLVGDASRMGVIRPAPVVRTISDMAAQVSGAAYAQMVANASLESEYQKQAIAALDERTTDCCLRVHGQIQPLNEPFKLTGTPRFADEIQAPPFHNFCRTAIVLYREELDLGLTAQMRDGARAIMNERAAGGSGERHPATAFA